MPQQFSLYAIFELEKHPTSDPFDLTRLPFDVVGGVRIEYVRSFFKEDTFKYVTAQIGTRAVEELDRVRYALVHRFDSFDGEAEEASKLLVRNVAACLRLLRPMRQLALSMQGTVREDGSFNVQGFDHPINLLEIPENQKLFHLRNRDADDLRKYSPLFLQAINGQIWKFKMAAQFHELGHFQDRDWKARYLLWSSAIESIYTSHNSEHKGSNVAKERIKWFLGQNTPIYPPGELSELVKDPKITLGSILDDLYEVRNYLAHGDKIPDHFFTDTLREGLSGHMNVLVVLFEAQSFIIRYSLQKVLRDGLTGHFAGAAESEGYFGGYGLTNSELRKKKAGP